MNALANPWITDDGETRFVLDERAFIDAIEAAPAFLESPTPEYLRASEIEPMLRIIARL